VWMCKSQGEQPLKTRSIQKQFHGPMDLKRTFMGSKRTRPMHPTQQSRLVRKKVIRKNNGGKKVNNSCAIRSHRKGPNVPDAMIRFSQKRSSGEFRL